MFFFCYPLKLPTPDRNHATVNYCAYSYQRVTKSMRVCAQMQCFVVTQDERNIVNGLGEIMKLGLVRSTELFGLLEEHGARLVDQRFQVLKQTDGLSLVATGRKRYFRCNPREGIYFTSRAVACVGGCSLPQ